VATAFLPRILGDFARARPRVNLAVTCDFTVNLLDQLSRGALDLALVKREPLSPELGDGVRREPLVWVAADEEIARARVIPLIAAPAPDVYRKRAIAALNAYGASFRVAYTSPSLAGQHAALRAGLGVAALPADMVPKDLTVLGAAVRLPPLEDTEIALVRAKGARSAAVDLLADEVVRSLSR
jgi:DNA-binding transcriptional LysR family regulator